MTARSKSSTTFFPVLSPIFLISSSSFAAFFSASFSAAALPEVCYRLHTNVRRCFQVHECECDHTSFSYALNSSSFCLR